MSGRVFLIPWKADAMATMAEVLLASPLPLHEHLVVFPHRRPRRYLLRAIAQRLPAGGPPVRIPRILAAGQWLSQLRADLPLPPTQTVSLLDRVQLLQEIVSSGGASQFAALVGVSPEDFFPWGVRLDSLLEECFLAAVRPQALEHMEEEVLPFAAGLLAALDGIYDAYVQALDARGWSTPGLDAFQVAAHVEAAAALVEEGAVYLTGFDDCSGVEETFFRHLWEAGRAHLVLHADPALASDADGRPHWSQGQMADLLARWQVGAVEPIGDAVATASPTPQLYEGYDLHSQLAALGANLREELAEHGSLDETAIIIAEPGMLMPVLHHLPLGKDVDGPDGVDVNVSLGFPLHRSNLAQLLELCMILQETAAGPGLYHWRELLALIRHPYLKMLTLDAVDDASPDAPDAPLVSENEQVLRPLFHGLERSLRQGAPMRHRDELGHLAQAGLGEEAAPVDPAHLAFLETIFNAFITAWEDCRTLGDVAAMLHRCCELLLAHGMGLWRRFPVDGECLHRLLHHVLPSLSGCTMRETPYPTSLLFAILRQLLLGERVPFEADPLTGLQVMGTLESRLLPFKRVHILGATDDVLPGRPGFDPLLPDALRQLMGLPDAWQQERRQAAVFFRCVESAQAPRIYTQTGATSSGLLDEKKLRSRFVEEALWTEEQRLGRLLTPGEPPLTRIQFPAVSLPQERRGLPATPALAALLADRLRTRPVSPTFLDHYIRCPSRCIQETLLRLSPQEEVKEEGDMAAVGEIVHQALQGYFADKTNRLINHHDVDGDALGTAFVQALAAHPLAEALRFDHRTATELAGRKRLKDYAAAFPETTILQVEVPITGQLEVDGHVYHLKGYMDRLDRRELDDDKQLLILDYKTGSVKLPRRRFWDGDHWPLLAAWRAPDNTDDEAAATTGAALLEHLAADLRSIQLPFYLYCAAQMHPRDTDILDAALIELATGGKERPLFGPKTEADERRFLLTDRIPTLLTFLFRHLLGVTTYPALRNDGCRHCTVSGGCLSGGRG